MKLVLKDKLTISEIKSKFTEYFPYLKLEIYQNGKKSHEPTLYNNKVKENISINLNEINNNKFEIDGNMTVIDLENIFLEKLKLYVQVFRKSGKLWLETTYTDEWTLYKQNEQDKELDSLNN